MKKRFMGIMSGLATIFMAYSYVPQLMLTFTTKNVEGQSLQFWILLTLALVFIDVIQIDVLLTSKEKNYGPVIFQTLNLILALVMLAAVIIFG